MTLTQRVQELEHSVDQDALDALADQLQGTLAELKSKLPEGVVAALHGDSLGHPLHPALVHLPLGGWMVAGLLDFWPGGDPGERAGRERAADLALLFGTLGAVPTVAAGWTDWSNVRRGPARREGLLHGLLAETAFTLCAASLLARKGGRRGLGKALSGAGLGAALLAGTVGGNLVYGHGLGVGRTLSTPQG